MFGPRSGIPAPPARAWVTGRLAHFPANLTPGIAGLGLALSLAVGLAAGYWPAVHASKLQPVDALRAE